MNLLFLALFIPMVTLLLLISFVVARLCDKVEAIIGRLDSVELVDDEAFMQQFAEYSRVPHVDETTRRRQLETLAKMMTPRTSH